VAIITNADIYFTSSLRCLAGPEPSDNRTSGRVYALSRRHSPLCGAHKADHRGKLDLCETYR